jgi:hypothetical protein
MLWSPKKKADATFAGEWGLVESIYKSRQQSPVCSIASQNVKKRVLAKKQWTART